MHPRPPVLSHQTQHSSMLSLLKKQHIACVTMSSQAPVNQTIQMEWGRIKMTVDLTVLQFYKRNFLEFLVAQIMIRTGLSPSHKVSVRRQPWISPLLLCFCCSAMFLLLVAGTASWRGRDWNINVVIWTRDLHRTPTGEPTPVPSGGCTLAPKLNALSV